MFKISWFTSSKIYHLFSYNNTDNYSISFLEFHYRAPQVGGACAILIDGTEYLHELCHCADTQVAECKAMCDTDESCKGYVKSITASFDNSSCQIATTSFCTSGCVKHFKYSQVPHTGRLVIDSGYSWESYGGCFIKLGKLSHQ